VVFATEIQCGSLRRFTKSLLEVMDFEGRKETECPAIDGPVSSQVPVPPLLRAVLYLGGYNEDDDKRDFGDRSRTQCRPLTHRICALKGIHGPFLSRRHCLSNGALMRRSQVVLSLSGQLMWRRSD